MFKIFVIDGQHVPNPEDVAMLQALYSRSASSVTEHLEKLRKSGSGRFLDNYVVNFGHKSIADCGSTTLFIEGVSLLAAKAIQDWPLYSGQETSTRYIDMSKQRIVDPVGTERSGRIHDRWMKFYTSSHDRVAETIRARYPKREVEKQEVYDRAVKARTFDILRGFLPAGITTQLSWHTNLRQAGDHLVSLTQHPTVEIRGIAYELRLILGERYPSSGLGMSLASVSGVGTSGGEKAREERESWEKMIGSEFTYVSTRSTSFQSTIEPVDLEPYNEIFRTRPRGCVLPHFLTDLGQCVFSFELDFGSFRDIQRHRNGVCRMPLLTTEGGFEPWYLKQLDDGLAYAAKELIEELTSEINGISEDRFVRQYYVALGFRVPCYVTYGLPAAVYVMELRSSKTVHPTLRRVTHEMIRDFRHYFPDLRLHVDVDPDDWDVRRGSQTILEKSI
jgi:thymidylate synthase ThyX